MELNTLPNPRSRKTANFYSEARLQYCERRKRETEDQWRQLIGQQFNSWTVVEVSGRNENGELYLKVRCKCGHEQENRAGHIKRGLSKGCRFCRIQSQHGHNSHNWKGGKFLSRARLIEMLCGARARKLEFTVNVPYLEELMERQDWKCAYSGVPITLPKKEREHPSATASLDRIDSSKGYIEGNVQWVHKTINFMKMNLSHEEFLFWCKTVAAHQETTNV